MLEHVFFIAFDLSWMDTQARYWVWAPNAPKSILIVRTLYLANSFYRAHAWKGKIEKKASLGWTKLERSAHGLQRAVIPEQRCLGLF